MANLGIMWQRMAALVALNDTDPIRHRSSGNNSEADFPWQIGGKLGNNWQLSVD